MRNILIVCAAGASSTFLASRMRALAAARGVDFDARAVSLPQLEERLPFADVLLVGPHLGESFDGLSATASVHGAVSGLLPTTVYGPDGADSALALATQLLPPARPIIDPSASDDSVVSASNEGSTHA